MQPDPPIASLWTGRHGALRAGSAGEQPATAYGTCLLVLQIHPTPGTSQVLYREANLNLRFPSGFPPLPALFSSGTAIAEYRRQNAGNRPNQSKLDSVLCPICRGRKKRALLLARNFRARSLGLVFEVGVRTPDSHALSNTWESVQKSGLLRNGVFLNGDV
jgi:hypothetical protein